MSVPHPHEQIEIRPGPHAAALLAAMWLRVQIQRRERKAPVVSEESVPRQMRLEEWR